MADPPAAFPGALAKDSQWLVRAFARPGEGHAVDDAALQELADNALARLAGV